MNTVKVKFKKGDNVAVLVGKDKGKTGKVISVNRKDGKVVVEGLNVRTRFEKKRGNKGGQKISFPAPMNASKIILVCPNCSKGTRIGYKLMEDGSKQRVCKKCEKAI